MSRETHAISVAGLIIINQITAYTRKHPLRAISATAMATATLANPTLRALAKRHATTIGSVVGKLVYQYVAGQIRDVFEFSKIIVQDVAAPIAKSAGRSAGAAMDAVATTGASEMATVGGSRALGLGAFMLIGGLLVNSISNTVDRLTPTPALNMDAV